MSKTIDDWLETYKTELSLAAYEGDASRLCAVAINELAEVVELLAAKAAQPPHPHENTN